MNKWGAGAIGVLIGSYGIKILTSQTMKSAYTHELSVILRMKDEVVKDFTRLKENCGDIAADAKDINQKRKDAEEAKIIEDARAVVEEADARAAAAVDA
ncbi:MAG: DUF6110 family protein [Anaerovoracaceae bacterium]|nr:DUF6110 family protein [Bacillota bacterium]MDY2671347.1 DUF6110 family protein [Anaerovoracaceae bacterium]